MRVLVHGEPLPKVRTRSVQWLLALLVLRQGRAVERSWLAGTLWPESTESQALKNLRDDLMRLRASLGPEAYRVQSPTRDTLLLDLDGADVDLVRFDQGIKATDEETLAAAAAAYAGQLLEDCYEEWVVTERETRVQQYLEALETLAGIVLERGEREAAIGYLRRAAAQDPLRESIIRRLMSCLADAGDPGAAVEAYCRLRERLHVEVSASPDAETTRLFREIREHARNKAGAKVSATQAPNAERQTPDRLNANLIVRPPLPLTPLIGREAEVESVMERLSQSRVVTLTGAGGVGKTRLAVEVAGRAAADSDQAVVWVELAPLAEQSLVLSTVAQSLGIRLEGTTDSESQLNRVVSNISDSSLLLALDNCEHLLDSVSAFVQTLLSRCAGLRVLVTSRQRLGLTGEVVWRIPSLPVADPDKLPADPLAASNTALSSPAIRLFVERGSAADSGFQMARREEVEAVCGICRRLDGIPLAIELAAARVRSLSVGEIYEKLDQRFSLLTGGSYAVLPRHQTLRSLIDWSYDLLNEAEKALLCRLAVFVGGWTVAAAEKVCIGEPVVEWDMLDHLTSLADKSLIAADKSGESTRYLMLETVRQYAHDRLTAGGEGKALRRRHFDFFLAIALEAEPHLLSGADQKKWLGRLGPDHDNFRAAMDWSVEAEETTEESLRMGGALWRFWMMRGHSLEGRARLSRALAASPAVATPARASVLTGAGNLAWVLGDYSAASNFHQESLAAFRQIGDQYGIAAALNNLGILANVQGDYASAKTFHEESLAMRRASDDRSGIAYSVGNLGLVIYSLGDYVTARALHEESLAIRRDLGDRRGIAISLSNLAMVALEQGEPESAHAFDVESLSIRWELDEAWGIAFSLEGLAAASAALGDPIRAARLWGAAEALREELGSPLPPGGMNRYERQVASARALFGDDVTFDAAWGEGRMLPLEEAVKLALELSRA